MTKLLIVNNEKARDVLGWKRRKKLRGEIVKEIQKGVERIDVAGGDGTLLEVIRQYWGHGIPFFGINRGTKGFLLNPIDSFEDYLDSFVSYYIIELNLLTVKFYLKNGEIIEEIAFNDVFFKNTIPESMCRGYIECVNDFESDFDGDGIIISTPQGSTAYNRSAGGHILSLKDDILAVTSICSFSENVKQITTSKMIKVFFTHGEVDGVADNRRIKNVVSAEIGILPRMVKLSFLNDYDFNVLRYRI